MIGSFCLGWFAHAQTRKPIMMTRIYTGPDGLSHAEEIEMKLNGNATEMIKATGIEFSRRAPNNSKDWHVGPKRQFVITLSRPMGDRSRRRQKRPSVRVISI